MALGGTIRGKKTSLRMPVEADLEAHQRWAADMRLRHADGVWHEPAMPATWTERLSEAAKDKQQVLWSIESANALVGVARARLWSMGQGVGLDHLVIDPDRWRSGLGYDAAFALHRYFFDYLDVLRCATDVRADNVAALRIAERLGYAEYARGHDAHYRNGAYVDQVLLFMDKTTWQERWSGEREYEPLPAESFR